MNAFARVFALVPDCHTSGRYQRVWRRHFYEGLQGAVPRVVLPHSVDFAWARPAPSALPVPTPEREETSERLWGQIKTVHGQDGLDVVISYCFASDIDPALIERTVELGVPWINFFCDSTYAFDRVDALARVVSLNWFPEHAAIPSYRATGRPLLCRPYALNPAALPEAVCVAPEHRLGFVGAPTSNRVVLLAALLALGSSATVRGEGWQRAAAASSAGPPRQPVAADLRIRGRLIERLLSRGLKPLISRGSRALSEAEMTAFLARCRVVLGLNEGRDLQGRYQSYLKLRDVEFPGYGCCYLTQHNQDIEQSFELEREVLTFRHITEAAAWVRWSVRHADAARAIGTAGRRRVLAEHTWTARLSELERAL